MIDKHKQPYFEHLQAYCISPYELALSDYAESREQKYKITTICWKSAAPDSDGNNPPYVMKKIYEMSLDEFREWVISTWRDEVLEDVISIEKNND